MRRRSTFPCLITTFLFSFLFLLNTHAQNIASVHAHPHEGGFCAQDHVFQIATKRSPELLEKHELLEESAYRDFHLQKYAFEKQSLADFTLPVVVHVIHDNGPENIPDDVVLQGIQDLNDAFANVGYYNPATGVDTRIQFCLAKRDPQGNATDGINRVQTPLTEMTLETDDIPVKDLSRWDPTLYINIWLVREICSSAYGCGVAGYAYFPSSHGAPEDGIMMEAEFFGSTPGGSGVQVHEMGHYLGLYHTFQGGCANNDCLADGDRVCDTPPDQSTAPVPCGGSVNSCSTDANSGFSTDQNDLFEDYMDYGDFDCWSVFTQGQTDRMHWHIENVRSSLLQSQGCSDPCNSSIAASFANSTNSVDAGGVVTFINLSTNATSAVWTIDGVQFSTITNTSYTFTQVGTFEICLEAGNADPNCGDRFCREITVTCPVESSFFSDNFYLLPGEQASFVNTSNTTVQSQWSVNGVVQSFTTDFTFNFPAVGAYSICLVGGNGFCSQEHCQSVFVAAPPVLPGECDSTFLKIYGTAQEDELGHALALVPDALGGGFLIGGGQGQAAMLTYLDDAGDIVWTRSFDATPDAADFIWDISFDSDNNVIGVGNTRDEPADNVECFAFKYNMVLNTIVWINELDIFDPAQEVYYSIYEKAPGLNYIVSGHTDQLGFVPSGRNAYLIELDRSSGVNVWQQNFDLGAFETFRRSIIANGDIYATGGYSFDNTLSRIRPGLSRISLDGTQQWSRLYLRPVTGAAGNARLFSTDLVSDNGLVVFGHGDLTGVSTSNVSLFLFRTDYDGNLEWAKEYDIPGAILERSTRLISLPDGYLCLGYFTESDQDVFVFKTDKQGNVVWSKSYGSPGLEDGFDMLWDNGLIYFTGKSNGIGSSGSDDLFLANLTPDGEPTSSDNCDLFDDLVLEVTDIPNAYDEQHDLNAIPSTWGQFLGTEIMNETSVQSNIACGAPCVEICDNGFDDDGDGYVDCYDADCPCNFPECVANPADLDQNFKTQLAWQSVVNEVAVDGTPLVANLNPQVDSIPEIVVIESKASITTQLGTDLLIFKGDGSNAANPLKLPITGGYDGYSAVNPAIGDLDGNGIPEVVMVSGDRRVRVYSFYNENADPPMQEIIVSSDFADNRNRKPYLADFNGDGMSEIYVGDDVFQFDPAFTTLTKALDGGSSAGLFYYQNYQEGNCSPVAVDILQPIHCNGDPDCDGLELVAGNVVYSVDLDIGDGDGLEIRRQRDLNIMQNQANFRDGYTSVADVDLDGILDIVVSSARNTTVGIYVWNRNGLVDWFPHPSSAVPRRSGGLPTIANVYDDTQNGAAIDMPEIIISSELRINCYNLNAAAMNMPNNAWWSLPTTDQSGATGATVFDFNGDGIEEIVYRDEENLRIMYGGATPFPAGVDAERNWETFVSGSGTFDEHPVIADVDNDGQANIILTSYTFAGTNNPPADYRGRLRVFEADLVAGDPWLSARPVWNQFNYFVVNIDDDLGLPTQQQLHQLEFPTLGSNYRPFNKFVSQVSLLDNNFQPYLPVPDATVSALSAECAPDSVRLTLEVCNEGSAPLPDGTPIAFYLSNPTTTSAILHFVGLLPENVPDDDCFVFEISIPEVNGTNLFVVVNDNGSANTPFNFGNDFPTSNVIECVYVNNPASILINFDFPVLDLGPDTTICEFGVVELDAGPGFASYLWQDGSMEQTLTAWNPGTYSVTAVDSCGNEQTDSITISLDPATVLNLGGPIEVCQGGSYTFNVSGFDTYEWTPADYLSCTDCPNPTTTPEMNITYTLVASSVVGCVSVDSVEIIILPAFEETDSIEICEGETITVFGMPVDTAGVFTENFTTANGCDSTQTIIVTVLPAFESIEDTVFCEGDTILVFGMPVFESGTFSETFSTQDGCDSIHTINVEMLETAATEASLFICFGETADVFGTPTSTAGTYEMTFVGANGCDSVHSITLEVNPAITLNLQPSGVSCFGGNDGSITATATGGSGGFTFLWDDGTTNPGRTGLIAGDYSCTVTDNSGCTAEASVSVSQPSAIELMVEGIDATCVDLGSASATAFGGTGDLTFSWSNGETTATITDLTAGMYSVTVTDVNGCTASDSVGIAGALGPEVSVMIDQMIVENEPNSGQLTANVSGGTAPFTYNWSNGATMATIDSLPSGNYLVTVTDANGCIAIDSAQLFLVACTGGKIWNDINRNGCQDGGEIGIPDVELTLSGVDIFGNSIADTTTSAINGEYIFEDLPPGDYQIHINVPTGYTLTVPDACADDFTDSDFDNTGTSYVVELTEGHCCLIVDGGLYDECLNVTDPGTLCCDQVLCGPGNDPAPIVSASPATGANPIEYMWIYSHSQSPAAFGNPAWHPVLDAFGNPVMTADYDPGPISETTYFARCTRAVGCSNWLETNSVKVTVEDHAVALINEPGAICVGDPITFTAAPNGPNASYHWYFGQHADPMFSSELSPTVVWSQAGYISITLEVTDNDCVSKAVQLIAVSDNPTYCGTGMIAQDQPINAQANGNMFYTGKTTQVEVFPNPFGDVLNIGWQSVGEMDSRVELMSIAGQQLRSLQVANGQSFTKMDVGGLEPGVYLLKVTTGDGEVSVVRVVKGK